MWQQITHTNIDLNIETVVAKYNWTRDILLESISFSHLQLLSLNGWKILLVRKDIHVYLCYSCETVCLETFMSLLKQIQIMQLFCCFFSSMLSSYFGLPFLCIHSRVCLSRKNCNLFSFWIFTATWGSFVHSNRKQKNQILHHPKDIYVSDLVCSLKQQRKKFSPILFVL